VILGTYPVGTFSSITGTSLEYGPSKSNRSNDGGGGYGGGNSGDGQPGVAGVVIVSYLTGSMTATGGTITTSGGNTIHTFTANGTFTRTA
jgi:hypothetical protein